jgi:glycine/D-amino acid oxidase-like deaminating enzyme/nitrite reductase/ring-hydroxylating ferredoxin subunit
MTGESYWTSSTGSTDFPALEGRHTADVAVIGGGAAGLWTAWELSRVGRRVIVVDAGRVAGATTGGTTGRASVLQSLTYSRIAREAGQEATTAYYWAQKLAVERILQVAAGLGVDCELERRPAYLVATTEQSLPALREELTVADRAGMSAVFGLEAGGLPLPVAGAVRLDVQLQFHPRKLLLAMATDLLRSGCAIFEHSRVVTVDDGEPCIAVTESGASVAAEHVVVATGYPITTTPAIRRALRPRRELVVAGPIARADAPDGMYVTAEDPVRSIRTAPLDADRRLLIVAGETFEPGAGGVGERLRTLSTWAKDHLGLKEVTYRWSAQDYDTVDHVPLIGPASAAPDHEHTWIATGFGGWGMSNSVAAAHLITAGIHGRGLPDWAAPFAPGRLEYHWQVNGTTADGAGRSAVRHRVEPEERAALAGIRPGEGAVVDIGGEHCAAYRDDSGILHVVSGVCSHLGCAVGFNDVEKTWECPCHGSRFTADGAVLQGPATRPLAPVAAMTAVVGG